MYFPDDVLIFFDALAEQLPFTGVSGDVIHEVVCARDPENGVHWVHATVSVEGVRTCISQESATIITLEKAGKFGVCTAWLHSIAGSCAYDLLSEFVYKRVRIGYPKNSLQLALPKRRLRTKKPASLNKSSAELEEEFIRLWRDAQVRKAFIKLEAEDDAKDEIGDYGESGPLPFLDVPLRSATVQPAYTRATNRWELYEGGMEFLLEEIPPYVGVGLITTRHRSVLDRQNQPISATLVVSAPTTIRLHVENTVLSTLETRHEEVIFTAPELRGIEVAGMIMWNWERSRFVPIAFYRFDPTITFGGGHTLTLGAGPVLTLSQ